MRSTILAALLTVSAGVALAQESGLASPKVAIIDMRRLTAESALGKTYAKKLEALNKEIEEARTRKQQELQTIATEIQTLQEEVAKQQTVLSAEALDKKQREIRRKERDREAFVEDGQAELQRLQERAQQEAQAVNNEFQTKIKPHIDAAAAELGVDILLDSQVTIFMKESFDITAAVITKADAALAAGSTDPGGE